MQALSFPGFSICFSKRHKYVIRHKGQMKHMVTSEAVLPCCIWANCYFSQKDRAISCLLPSLKFHRYWGLAEVAVADYISSIDSQTCCLPELPYEPKKACIKHDRVNIPYSCYQLPDREEIQHPDINSYCLCMYFPSLVPCVHFAVTTWVCVEVEWSKWLHRFWNLFTPNLNS